jgi:transposase InsO family protein
LALSIAGVSKHQYYYRSTNRRKGRKPTETTLKKDGDNIERCPNDSIIDDIKAIQKDPDTDYGYKKMYYALLILGYLINRKKVYRLMRENQLLKDKPSKAKRTFAKYRKVMPQGPLTLIEMDIKFVWVEEYKRHAYVLTAIDTYTRVVLGWKVSYQIKQDIVKRLWQEIIENHLQPYDCINKKMQVEIRNDNDSRFVAKSVQEFFESNQMNQVFTHPYTPQENGHIESFHAILSRKLDRYTFWSISELEQCLVLFYEKYNNHRLHSSIANLPPMVFWDCWEKQLIETKIDEAQRKIKHKLKIPYNELSGKMSLRAVPCSQPKTLDGFEGEKINEMSGAESLLQPSV